MYIYSDSITLSNGLQNHSRYALFHSLSIVPSTNRYCILRIGHVAGGFYKNVKPEQSMNEKSHR